MLLRLLIFFAILWFAGKILRFLITGQMRKKQFEQRPSTLVQDPTCGVYFDPRSAVQILDWKGEKKYFCSQECYETFLKENSARIKSSVEPSSR